MGQRRQMNDREKELLTTLGRNPDLSLKELLNYTQYKQVSSITRKINQFREQNILWGPTYLIDYGKLCKNPVHRLFCIVELGKPYETVIEYLKLIESLVWVYPVLSSHKKVVSVSFLSSNDEKIKALLQILKDNNIITDYIVRVRRYWTIIENPNFFGDFNPSLDNLLEPCEFPPLFFGHHETVWNKCDIAALSHLSMIKGIRLIDILKKERLKKRYWTYEQIKYSHEKMLKNKLITKTYFIFPYPLEQCADFYLFIKTDDLEVTQRILYNFTRGERIHREYTLCNDWGLIGCICHPQVVLNLMHKLDKVTEITKKELYHLRSVRPGMSFVSEHIKYYDVEKQTLEYPYSTFKEKIKERLENEIL